MQNRIVSPTGENLDALPIDYEIPKLAQYLKEWVEKQKPLGGTNIYDSLELGFKIAHRTTGAPDLDTIFFLTDGKPTAGKIRDSQRILDVFRAWNETSHLTIHTIGIGKDHDAEFLKELAKIGDGTYIAR